ncbi:hypothetical protein [Bowmanella dokdonensis]|uniref:Uncharacterized protein n=1 Tax=Bowmanella dokdonensis TaxID=751969 RepID=A0A939DQT0_9ALTE|nr:hypothetical protein [Bowmanella dokdonensis]MBN7826677.1 hypothetical protein [Bowmanella dokdonensis]
MKAANRRQSKRSNILVLLEGALIAYLAYVAHALIIHITGESLPAGRELLINVALLTFLVLVSALSVGLYEPKLRETFRGIIRRIFVCVALSYFVMELLTSTVLINLSMHPYYLPTASGLIILSLVVFRYFSNRLGLLGLGHTLDLKLQRPQESPLNYCFS